ncbi:MAG: hypothetical protein Q9228_004435, partial [Teloschistes exilis]
AVAGTVRVAAVGEVVSEVEVLGSDSGIVERVGEGIRVRENLVAGDLAVEVVVVVGEARRVREDLAVVVEVKGCCWWYGEEAMGLDHEIAGAARGREEGLVEDGMMVFSEQLMEGKGRCVVDFSEVRSGSEDPSDEVVDSVGLSGEGRRIRGDGIMMVREWSKVENLKSTLLGAEMWYLEIFWPQLEV